MAEHPVTAYARAVVAGEPVAGRLVRLACERHLRDLADGPARGLRFDEAAASHAIEFFPRFLTHIEAPHAGQPFTLAPWQQFVIGSVFGWKGPDGFRRFRTAYVETGKGNGKTPLVGGVLLYALAADGEDGAEVYCAAVTRDQAKIMFADAKKMAEASPALARHLDIGENNIADLATRSFLRPVSSEGRSLDGKRVHVAGIDEIHEHPSSLVVDKMRAGTKGRRQALIFEITNAGYDRLSVCWQHHDFSAKVLERVVEQDSWFAYVCQLDPCEACRAEGYTQPNEGCVYCDAWTDARAWPKANPNLDVSITRKYLREQIEEAQGMPAKRDIVLRLNLCVWTTRFTAWIPADRWRACSARIEDDDLIGVPCFAGLDLGQSDDFSALVLSFLLPDGRVATRARYWIPEATLRKRPERPYGVWQRADALVVTDGEITDYDLVEADVAEWCARYGVQRLAYDKRFAEQMRLHLEGKGITCVDMPQGYQLNEAIGTISDRVKKGQLCHGGDPVMAWMVSNVVLRRGTRGEVRFDKERAADKIDGPVAHAMGMALAIVQPDTRSVYETRGPIVIGERDAEVEA